MMKLGTAAKAVGLTSPHPSYLNGTDEAPAWNTVPVVLKFDVSLAPYKTPSVVPPTTRQSDQALEIDLDAILATLEGAGETEDPNSTFAETLKDHLGAAVGLRVEFSGPLKGALLHTNVLRADYFGHDGTRVDTECIKLARVDYKLELNLKAIIDELEIGSRGAPSTVGIRRIFEAADGTVFGFSMEWVGMSLHHAVRKGLVTGERALQDLVGFVRDLDARGFSIWDVSPDNARISADIVGAPFCFIDLNSLRVEDDPAIRQESLMRFLGVQVVSLFEEVCVIPHLSEIEARAEEATRDMPRGSDKVTAYRNFVTNELRSVAAEALSPWVAAAPGELVTPPELLDHLREPRTTLAFSRGDMAIIGSISKQVWERRLSRSAYSELLGREEPIREIVRATENSSE